MITSNRSSMRTICNKTLAGAIVAALALALGGAGTAMAQSTSSYTLSTGAPWTQVLALNNYIQSVNNTQTQLSAVSASLNSSDSIFDIYAGTGTAQTNSSNTISALAVGNNATGSGGGNSIAMSLLSADGFGNSGLGIQSGQLNNANTVNSSVNGGQIYTTLTGYTGGTVTQDSNTITSNVVMNDASSTISGNLPAATFTGTTNGSVNVAFDAASATVGTVNMSGDISVGSQQANVGTDGSGAAVSGAGITIGDSGNGATAITADFSNSNNTITGSYIGNRSANGVDATGADGAPTYNGSVVVSNGQANLAAGNTTSVDVSPITTTLADGSFQGSLTQSNDNISASTQGNTTSNAISFASGINVAGNAGSTTLSLAFGNSTVTSAATGDLVLLNEQRNQQGTGFSSEVKGDNIEAIANAVATAGASISLSGDQVSSSTGGNAASNTVSADGSSFAGNVAVGNQQSNDTFDMSSSATGINVGADLTDGAATSLGNVSIGSSSIVAVTQASQATTDVSLSGTNFSAGSGVVTGYADQSAFGTLDTGGAGVSVGNLQGYYGAGNTITATAGLDVLGAYYAGGIGGGSSTVSGNAIGASAGGNLATTSASLSGDNGVFTAALVNNQYLENAITGQVQTPILGIVVKGAAADTTLTANSNSFSATANGNQGTNSLSSDFTNATLGDGAGAFASASAVNDFNTNTPSATGALILASNQKDEGGSVTATLADGQMGVQVGASGGDVSNTPVTVNSNDATASAVVNQVSNTLDPGVGNVSTVGGMATQVATLANNQIAYGNTTRASVSLDTAVGLGLISAQFAGNVSGSPVTVSSNTVSAFTAGNMAGNGMAASGTNYAPTAVTGTNGMNYMGTNTVTAEYTLQNAQDDFNGGSRTASVSNGTVGAAALGNIDTSPLTVSSNQIGADARDNYVTNTLSFGGFSTLSTTGALQSEQIAGYFTPIDITSSVSGTTIAAGSLTGSVSGSDVTASGNGLTSKAIGNTGINTLSVQAGQLGGNSVGIAPDTTLRGAAVAIAVSGTALADYSLNNHQIRVGATSASITDGQIGGGAGTDFNGGSLTLSGNSQTALAQANSASNGVNVDATNVTASAALLNMQENLATSSASASASVTSGDAFAAYIGGALGTTTAVPVTVSGNTLVAQAGFNTASNALDVSATGAINGTGLTGSGASTDYTTYAGYQGAVADFANANMQFFSDGNVTATASPGLVGVEVAAGGIGTSDFPGSLTVNANHVGSQASANDASTSVSLTGAGRVGATTAVYNAQVAGGAVASAVTATTSNAQVGIYDDTGAAINRSNMTVSGNSLSAGASGNSASNAISVQPVALNAGSTEGTLASVGSTGSTALASNALLNRQGNFDAISATVQNSTISVNPGAGTASVVLNSGASVGGNSAVASGSGNSASNAIMLASLPSGVASSALVSYQSNLANVTATVSNVQIGMSAGATSTTPVTVSGNTISATAVGNSATNHIGIGN